MKSPGGLIEFDNRNWGFKIAAVFDDRNPCNWGFKIELLIELSFNRRDIEVSLITLFCFKVWLDLIKSFCS